MDRNKFNEALTSLVEYAHANAGHVNSNDIKLHFKEILEDDSHFTAVYDYLKASGIAIDDVAEYENVKVRAEADESADNSKAQASSVLYNSETEKELVGMYRDEIENITISALKEEEYITLLNAAKSGDVNATNRLIESYLPSVIDIASEYESSSLSGGDLIQEGNLGLTTAVYDIINDKSDADIKYEKFDASVRHSIRKSIEDACDMQNHSNLIGNRLATRLNALDEASSKLSELNGSAPSKAELAKEMHISEDEVDILIRTSLNVLTVDAEKKYGNEEDIQNT